jgi:hypothetical protein
LTLAPGSRRASNTSEGQFLVKDAALLGISVWTLGDALRR